MAFGKGTPYKDNPNRKVYSFVIRTKDLPKPLFEVKVKNGDKFELVAGETDTIAGEVVAVKHSENKYQGKVIRSVNVTMTDGDDLYHLSIPYSNLGRGLINALCSLENGKNVSISLYQTKPKMEGGKSYPASAVRQNDELVRWKYQQDELPAVKKIPYQGTMISDTIELDNFFAAKVGELNKVLNPKSKAATAAIPEVENDEAPPATSSDENVPF